MRVEDFSAMVAGVEMAPEPVASPRTIVETPHASIDRKTWTTTPGGKFFLTEAQALADGFDSVEVYLRAAEGWEGKVTALLQAMAPSGFGRDKSVGYKYS